MKGAAHEPDRGADLRPPPNRDWLLVYLVVACCVAIAFALVLVAVGVL